MVKEWHVYTGYEWVSILAEEPPPHHLSLYEAYPHTNMYQGEPHCNLCDGERSGILPYMEGVWISDESGWHSTYLMVYRAQRFGFKPGPDSEEIIRQFLSAMRNGDIDPKMRSLNGDVWVFDAMWGLSEAAIGYLREKAPEGYTFEWTYEGFCLLEGLK